MLSDTITRHEERSDLDSDTSDNGESEVSSEGEAHNSQQPLPPFDYDQYLAALRGEVVPDDLTFITARRAVVRGIRCRYDFATSTAVAALHILELYARAMPEAS
jgi:hypothetical protein